MALPPVPRPSEAFTTGSGRMTASDAILMVLVLVLAFLSASFVAHNSDLWLHRALGRLLAQGQFQFGIDPFAYSGGQGYWVHHTWLADLAFYELYERIGGAGLVVLKAVLVAALAGFLVSIRRPTGGAGVPVLCTTLALLAMSPRLLLQPACLSYFLLGLTFWLLVSPQSVQPEATDCKGRTPWRWLTLLSVFVLWVNIEEWFLLGPALTALFWLGERLAGQRRTPGWLIPAGLAVCLLNPHTYHVFTLPAELAPDSWASGLRQDVRFQALFASPWQPAYLNAATELNAAVLAYYLLTFLGMVSFALHRPALRDGRLVVWLPFALLAAWQARTIPFFAIVAAPITSLNGQDFLAAHRRERSPLAGPGFLLSAGRVLMAAALLALIFLTWPGWLAGYGREARRVGWGVQEDASLQRTAQTLDRWRSEGRLSDGERVFALAPEVLHYAAWFAPREKHFFDYPYSSSPEAARDYETVCRALVPGLVANRPAAGERDGAGADWRQVLRDHGVSMVIVYDRNRTRMLAALGQLGSDSEQWTLLRVEGEAQIFGWNEARPSGGFVPLAFDADRLAFGPQDEETQRQLPAAPGRGPAHLPAQRDFRTRLLHPAALPTWESAAATVYLHYFHGSAAAQLQREQLSALASYVASLAGLPALPTAVPGAAWQVFSSRNVLYQRADASAFLGREQLGPYFAHLTERSPALPLLAVRAARRAVAENPEDSNAWLQLGHAYMLLRMLTHEHSASGLFPPLGQLRNIQIITTLEQAVRLDPDLEAAHEELAHLYGEQRYLDQALKHLHEMLRLSRRAGPRPGETDKQWAYRLEMLGRDASKLEEDVLEQRRRYTAASRSLQGERPRQAGLAAQMGLPVLALEEILLLTPADVLGATGVKMELELLLSLGRIEEVREILNDENVRASKQGLPYHDLPVARNPDGTVLYTLPYHWPSYDWLQALQAAAVGDYGQARDALRSIRAGLHAGYGRLSVQLRDLDRGAPTLLPGLLSGPPLYLPTFTALILGRLAEDRKALHEGAPFLLAQQADLCVLEGLLALEEGAPNEARAAFAEAEKLCVRPGDSAIPFAGRPIAVRYLGKLTVRDASAMHR